MPSFAVVFLAHAEEILGWAGYVRVDGKVYLTMGVPSVPNVTAPTKATQTDLTVRTPPTFSISLIACTVHCDVQQVHAHSGPGPNYLHVPVARDGE